MKKQIYILSLVVATLTLSFPAFADQPVLGVNRIILQYRNGPPQSILSLLDFGHAQMLNLGLYTQADATKLDQDAYAYFLKVVGLDFRTAVTDPNTGFLVVSDSNGPVAVLAPFIIGADGSYNVLYDSDAPYKNNGGWTVRNFSDIMLYIRSGTVASGTAAGQTFQAGDLVSYGYTDELAKGANWSLSPNRDHFIVSTIGPQKQPVDDLGQTDEHVALQYIDSDGNVGFGSDNVYNNQPGNAANNQISQHQILFLANPAPAVTP